MMQGGWMRGRRDRKGRKRPEGPGLPGLPGVPGGSGYRPEGRRPEAHRRVWALLTISLALGLGACATVGHEFPVARVGEIRLQQTTQEEIRAMFGEPWRVGVEDGRRTWTYGRYRYKLFGQPSTQDLVLRFDERGTVVSYTFNTTELEQAPAIP